MPVVNVIIPTTCESRRWPGLLRAISCLTNQEGVAVDVLVVVNGQRYDAGLFEQLRARADVRVIYQAEGSLPAALRLGRSLVTHEYFGFLDDDDEYLPGALLTRLKPMLQNPELDVVATNGYACAFDDRLRTLAVEHINDRPLEVLVGENWLASCGGLFRSAAITLEYFDGVTKHFEWTLLAFRIVNDGHPIRFLNVATFRINDTPESLSKSSAYQRGAAEFIEKLLAMNPPPRVRQALRRKLSAACHDLAEQYRSAGDRRNAWRYHLRSLAGPGGFRYASYTRWLLVPPRAIRS